MEKDKEKSEAQNSINVLKKRLQENRKSLHIARVPDNTKATFMKLAEKEFCGDYGMTLKWLIDDILSQDNRMIIERLEDHEIRIHELETKEPLKEEPPNENTKRMVDGSLRVVRGSRKNEQSIRTD